MSQESRLKLRKSYMEAWYQMDAELLLATTTEDFIFDDPMEPEPVTRSMLPEYMLRWDKRAREHGADNQWKLTHEVRVDEQGILTNWEWWELLNTQLQGAAVVLTNNDGVLLERITYFDR